MNIIASLVKMFTKFCEQGVSDRANFLKNTAVVGWALSSLAQTFAILFNDKMPKKEQAIGTRSREPPATPEAPQTPRVAIRLRKRAETKLTCRPIVGATDRERTVIVTAAPSMLIVEPSGMLTE